jgi:hypothetical protein
VNLLAEEEAKLKQIAQPKKNKLRLFIYQLAANVAWESGMDRFFDQQNIGRYRQLASARTSETKRKLLLTLLAAEEAEFKRDVSSQGTSRLIGSLRWKGSSHSKI